MQTIDYDAIISPDRRMMVIIDYVEGMEGPAPEMIAEGCDYILRRGLHKHVLAGLAERVLTEGGLADDEVLVSELGANDEVRRMSTTTAVFMEGLA